MTDQKKRRGDAPGSTDSEHFEGTEVDLGEDLLLERTRALPGLTGTSAERESDYDPWAALGLKNPDAPSDPEDSASELHSARILIDEGLTEQAKKILHRILLRDTHNVPARQALHGIHESELKQIFNEERARRTFGPKLDRDEHGVDSEEVMLRLDRELGLGITAAECPGREFPGSDARFSLFQDAEAMEAFARNLDQELRGSAPVDRIDMGIAFIEMGLFELAGRQFREACRELADAYSGEEAGPATMARQLDLLISATSLLALSHLSAGKPFEASLALQPLVSDLEIPAVRKIELFYLLGRAHEGMKKPREARYWYEKVREFDARYRDAAERLRLLQRPKRPGRGS